MMSFTEFEKVCELHTQNDANLCYCDKQSDIKIVLCNKYNCHFYQTEKTKLMRGLINGNY